MNIKLTEAITIEMQQRGRRCLKDDKSDTRICHKGIYNPRYAGRNATGGSGPFAEPPNGRDPLCAGTGKCPA
jgi:hypothetical protein